MGSSFTFLSTQKSPNMKILVTGSSGFLGSHLCPHLKSLGHELIELNSKNADLTKQDSLLPFKGEKIKVIYHLAAWTQAGDFCLHHPGEQWIINQQINTNMLAWWQAYHPGAKLISMGTSCSYALDRPMVEENYLTGSPVESLFTYAMGKRMLQIGLMALNQQYGMNYLTLVPSTLYGPGYHTDGRQMHFIFDLIFKIMRGKIFGDPVVFWGDGHQRRELVFVADFVRVAAELADSFSNDIFNVGGGVEYSIRDFARMICMKVGYDFKAIRYDTSKYVGATSKCLKTGKIEKICPEFPMTSLEEGLSSTIDWFWSSRSALFTDKK